eukprot:CAMPEP_0194398992 /NCGR_PEP_ID=MMETSP0174-20130528/126413_1 /TAXON_ID=216777 /ORGANISM="Proboscia alata, Strain PI-D3" /LENGTH=241 /DNA_ID=CAMNT_0039195351 /DNA_START=1053 /DNA_END=1778 /DNA_ORIENTATION=-
MILQSPSIVGLNFKDNIRPKLEAIEEYLQLSEEELHKTVVRCPQVISLNFEGNVKPTLEALKGYLGINQNQLKKIVIKSPHVTLFNFDDNIKPTIDALQECLDLSNEQLRHLLLDTPSLINVKLVDVKPKIDWLKTTFDLNQHQLLTIMQKNKMLLKCSLEKTLIPNYDLLKGCYSYIDDSAKLNDFIITHPRDLGQSQEKLMKRVALFDDLGISRSHLMNKANYGDDRLDQWILRQDIVD